MLLTEARSQVGHLVLLCHGDKGPNALEADGQDGLETAVLGLR